MLKPAWGAVFALAFGVIVLTAAQTLPVSLLTPLAADLHISEGLAGQTMTATSALAFVASLIIAFAARSLKRSSPLPRKQVFIECLQHRRLGWHSTHAKSHRHTQLTPLAPSSCCRGRSMLPAASMHATRRPSWQTGSHD